MNNETQQKRLSNHAAPNSTAREEEVSCDRCSRPMFRMRAVYWCEYCGYKTDCCGS